jgi:hypothetical protein
MTAHPRLEYAVGTSETTGQHQETGGWHQETARMGDKMDVYDRKVYKIRVQGRLSKRRSGWFEGMTMRLERAPDDTLVTTLTGPVVDQARLRGILSKLWDLNLTLISVTCDAYIGDGYIGGQHKGPVMYKEDSG